MSAVQVRLAPDPMAALPHLARALKHHVHGRSMPVADLAHGHAVFELVADGRVVGAFTLAVHEHDDGRVMHCSAAGGEPGFDLVSPMFEFAESEARGRIGARAMVCETRRLGLVRKLQRSGGYISGYIMRKDFQ